MPSSCRPSCPQEQPISSDPAPIPGFALDPRLEADTIAIGELALSRLLLMDDNRFPWLVLVPRRPQCREIVDLTAEERSMLIEEIALCSSALSALLAPHKLNVGAIGNRVAQLHVHVIARFETDAAWPDPVWGRGSRIPYEPVAGRALAGAIWSGMGFV